MPRMTYDEYIAYQNRRASSSAQPERTVQAEPLGQAQGKEADPIRIHVCVTSFRRRLLDPDNLCPKFFIDSLRYAGLIPNDRQEDISLHVHQYKVTTKAEERTEIEVT